MQRIVGGASWCLVAFVVMASLGGVLAHSAWASGTPEAAQSRSLRDPGGHHYHGRHGGEHYHRGHNPGGPHGGSHHAKWPQATLQAQAQAEVPQDMVRIVLATQLSDSSQQAVAKALTAAINTAMERARGQSDGVTVSSGNFRVWPMNDKDGNISNWRGSGEIVLESDDFDAASGLASQLSDVMAIASVGFFVSPQTRAREEEQLLAQAAAAFRDRAQALAEAMGYSGYSLRSVDLGGSGMRFEAARMMAQPAMMAADSVALEGGTEVISVSVSGSVFLRNAKTE